MLYIATHSFLAGLQEIEFLFFKASQAKMGGSLVTRCLGTGKGAPHCRAVLALCARLAGARRPPWVGDVCKKVSEGPRSPREGPSTPPSAVPVLLTSRPEPRATRARRLQERVQSCPQHGLSLASQSSVGGGGGG